MTSAACFSGSTRRSFTRWLQKGVTPWVICRTVSHVLAVSSGPQFSVSTPPSFHPCCLSGDDEGQPLQDDPLEVCGVPGASQSCSCPMPRYGHQRQHVRASDSPHALQAGATPQPEHPFVSQSHVFLTTQILLILLFLLLQISFLSVRDSFIFTITNLISGSHLLHRPWPYTTALGGWCWAARSSQRMFWSTWL